MPTRSSSWRTRIEFPTIISPLCFTICWIIALATYNTIDLLFVYAILDLVVSIVVVVVQLTTSFEHVAKAFAAVAVVLFFTGWFWFSNVVGLNVFQLAGQPNFQWTQYPFLIRVLFIQIWLRFIFFSYVFLYFIIAIVIAIVVKSNKQRMRNSDTDASLPSLVAKTGQRIARYTLPHEETQWTVTRFHDWLYKNDCIICAKPLEDDDDDVIELVCKHRAHSKCLNSIEIRGPCQHCLLEPQDIGESSSNNIRLQDMFGA